MTDKRFVIVDLLETLAIANDDECKYYQNSNDDFKKLCELLNELHEENEQSKLMIATLRNIILENGIDIK